MKRVVADANVLVSALEFEGKPKHLLDLTTDGQVDLAILETIIAETLRVLKGKCAPREKLDAALGDLRQFFSQAAELSAAAGSVEAE